MAGDSEDSREGQRRGWAQHGLTRRQLLAWDGAAALAFAVGYPVLSPVQHGDPAPVASHLPLFLAMSLPLAVRRLWPRTVLLVVVAASAAGAVLDIVLEPFLAVAYALYAVAVSTSKAGRAARWIVVGGSALILLVLVVGGAPSAAFGTGLPVRLSGLIVCGLTWASGQAIRERRAYAERAARQLALNAVAQERLRIARELHDVVAHHVGVIAVKAGVARHVAAVAPEEATEALRVIDQESRTALQEMRGILGLLRNEPDGTEGPRHPDRSLTHEADVQALVHRAGEAGVEVRLSAQGLGALPDGVARAGHRVVQEALTNVIKHAAPCYCRLVLLAGRDQLRLEILDDGGRWESHGRKGVAHRVAHGMSTEGEPRNAAGTGHGQAGHGLIGMRERVAMYGGELTAGPLPGGGFVVRARIPLPPRQVAPQEAARAAAPDAPGENGSASEPVQDTDQEASQSR
ncbi:sensor histidine kinase [Streptomyces sp. RK75]|uniref:sensor histidine kinase n=1 Tax=Streptomyces sp. RK75 TaxID=2824895 RepID=UPI001B395A6D|nr:histidine kinase [Streptomyces sp. RK75]MBQ0867279.1 sensor histidine kinase [Streptomyces sp. RK75]